ncbi:MAG: hypothetical protein IJJ26_03740 [Victivallales bacterium]|nr:hypothetical protein [Victivallales bacterium]
MNNEYYYSAAENVSILAGILVVGSGTFAENVNATGVTWSKTDSEGITSHFYQSGTISIASGGSARNVTLGTFGAAQNAGVIEHLSVHSGGLYAAGGTWLKNSTNGGYIERFDGVVATGKVSGLNFIGYLQASAATLENMTFNWLYDDVRQYVERANAWLDNGCDLKGGVVSGMSDSDDVYARVYLSSGASASGTLVDGGLITFSEGASGREIVVQSNGVVSAGNWNATENAVVSHTRIFDGGIQKLDERGVASNTEVYSGGTQILWDGSALQTTVHAGGTQYLSGRSPTATSTRIEQGGLECIVNGWSDSAYVQSGGTQRVYYGGWAAGAQNAQVYGTQENLGGLVSSSIIYSGGSLVVNSGGTAFGIDVRAGGRVSVQYGTISGLELASDASLLVESGGSVNDLLARNGATVIASGSSGWRGTLRNCDFYNTVLLEDGGEAYDIRLHSGASLDVASSCYVSNFTVDSQASVFISSGASFDGLVVSGGTVELAEHMIWELALSDGHVNRNGGDYYSSGYRNVVTDKGRYHVTNGEEWRLTVSAGGVVEMANAFVSSGTVGDGGTLYCRQNTELAFLTVENGGVLSIEGATISQETNMQYGSELSFQIAGYAADDLDAWLSGMSEFSGRPSISVVVDPDQAAGKYVLADANAGWVTSVSISEKEGEASGNVSMNGGATRIGKNTYRLSLGENDALVLSVSVEAAPPVILSATATRVTWDSEDGGGRFVLGDGNGFFQLTVETEAVSLYGLPEQDFTVQVYNVADEGASDVVPVQGMSASSPECLAAKSDGETDLMFGRSMGQWDSTYRARHMSLGYVAPLKGRNIIGDLLLGSDDATILLLTDDDNGDALFLDDIYSAFPDGTDPLGGATGPQARVAMIDEIRAGAGDDVVDLTSQRFTYVGDGITVHGGLGDDVLWANHGENTLFGDAGNDRLAGASGDDVLVGGTGDDSLQGGGGNDLFTFGGVWGNDTVAQLEGGSSLLWFDGVSREEFSLEADANGNAVLSCTSGTVTLEGVKATDVSNAFASGSDVLQEGWTLRFGNNDTAQYNDLLAVGAFADFTSELVFDDKDKVFLA